jgi:tagatose 1,6-diphosphate aldolase GatY/KbaY
MLASFAEILEAARGHGRAAGGFVAYDLTTGEAILRAASTRQVGVIVIVSAQAYAASSGPGLLAGLVALAEDAPVPACVQLDHVSDLAMIERALAGGAGAVMADGSMLPYDDNRALVREAVLLAEARGAAVEAELGRIEGDEEVARATDAGALTDPVQAADFMRATGAHCLAVSIGNVHGAYRHPVRLDWQRLRAVAASVSRPLSLHGASGIPEADVREAVAEGIAKVNVNTELRERWFQLDAARAPELAEGSRLLRLQRDLADGLAEFAGEKLAALESRDRAGRAPA